MTEEIRERLIKEAKYFKPDELWKFLANVGFEDWMLKYQEDPEAELFTEKECEIIDNILKEIFDEAHKGE